MSPSDSTGRRSGPSAAGGHRSRRRDGRDAEARLRRRPAADRDRQGRSGRLACSARGNQTGGPRAACRGPHRCPGRHRRRGDAGHRRSGRGLASAGEGPGNRDGRGVPRVRAAWRVLLGSVATQLVRSAPCPLIVTPRGMHEKAQSDGRPRSERHRDGPRRSRYCWPTTGSASSATAIAVAGRLRRTERRSSATCGHGGEETAPARPRRAPTWRGRRASKRHRSWNASSEAWRTLGAADRNDAAVVVTGAHGVSGRHAARQRVDRRGPSLAPAGARGARTRREDRRPRAALLRRVRGLAARDHVAGEELGSRRGPGPPRLGVVGCRGAARGLSATVQGMAAELDEVASAVRRPTAEGVQVAEAAASPRRTHARGAAWRRCCNAGTQSAPSSCCRPDGHLGGA